MMMMMIIIIIIIIIITAKHVSQIQRRGDFVNDVNKNNVNLYGRVYNKTGSLLIT